MSGEINALKRLVRDFMRAHDERTDAELALAQAGDAYQACDDEDTYERMEDIEKASEALRQAEHAYSMARMALEDASRKDGEA